MKKVFVYIAFMLSSYASNSQTKLTLREAIETGLKNNLQVNQSDLLAQKADIGYRQSRATMLPDLNAIANHGTNQGRSIDPFTNGFIDQNVNYASYSASSSILLFNGSSLQNRIKTNKLDFEASKMELQQAKDNITINIILAYLGVLSAQDILEQSRSLVLVTEKQVERLGILNDAGAITPSDYYDLKGQLANDQIAIVDNAAALETAKLDLLQLLNLPYDKSLQVERLPTESFNVNSTEDPAAIYQAALDQFAQIKAVNLRTQSAEKNIRSIKGELFPRLFFGANVNTNYSSAATQAFFVNSVDVTSNDYVDFNGSQVSVIRKQDNYDNRKINFGNQLKNNKFTTFNFGLNVPLFNASQVRSRVKIAKIDFKNSELVELNTKTQLQQSIERAYVNMSSTAEKYNILTEQVKAFDTSFRGAEIRFNAGATTSVDYLIAKNNLDRTTINLIISKYDFILRSKVLDYYKGVPLW
ncbi:MAG: TolC family protein [Ginsengibacter sp.]